MNAWKVPWKKQGRNKVIRAQQLGLLAEVWQVCESRRVRSQYHGVSGVEYVGCR